MERTQQIKKQRINREHQLDPKHRLEFILVKQPVELSRSEISAAQGLRALRALQETTCVNEQKILNQEKLEKQELIANANNANKVKDCPFSNIRKHKPFYPDLYLYYVKIVALKNSSGIEPYHVKSPDIFNQDKHLQAILFYGSVFKCRLLDEQINKMENKQFEFPGAFEKIIQELPYFSLDGDNHYTIALRSINNQRHWDNFFENKANRNYYTEDKRSELVACLKNYHDTKTFGENKKNRKLIREIIIKLKEEYKQINSN